VRKLLTALGFTLVSALPGLAAASSTARGATPAWTTYEAEAMTFTGQLLGPTYGGHDAASESSGRQCVRLSATGHYVQFTASSNATAIVVRYSVPDTPDGAGADYTLGLYQNGTLVGRLPMTSRYSWLYGAYPFNNFPTNGSPRNFFDEVRTNGLLIHAGDVLRLQKDSADTAAWYDLDLVDLESVAPPLPAPADSLSLIDYGGVGDGTADCTSALQNCIAAAQAQGKAVWIPAGQWLITGTITLPSETTLQGSGMWHTRLIGSPGLYNAAPSRRVTLIGNGSNIHLADFAIIGCLNYRHDSEPNDGLGGSYGTGSTISGVWVEHTKTGAWLVNSSGLMVDGCRFRDTLADGINLCVGMRNTTVTNCTARGTGDDCFAIWPADYITPAYNPGLNLITHCTGQMPFLANGGAIYGADSNRIEDCLFQDVPYQSGVLLSTTFPVGSDFSGTTVVQRCGLNRCGGTPTEPSGGLQLCLQNRPISGLNLNALDISNSVTCGASIIYGAGPLSNAILAGVTIMNYGLGGGTDAHALWARADARGSLTVSNSYIIEYQDDSPDFEFQFAPPPPQRILNVRTRAANLLLTYATLPWCTYHVEASPALAPASWTLVPGSATNATAGAVTFTTPIPPGSAQRFYRIVSP
jgi:Alpha-1,3-glucanase catalytic domain D1/Alpha-1,3-glucanase catalytic domain D2